MKEQNLIKALKRKLESKNIDRRIVALYLYGSIISGKKLRDDSDIDIAMLVSHKTSGVERVALISEIEELFTNIFISLGINNQISILDMRSKYASLQLLYEVITKGACIYERAYYERLEFENIVKREYFDFAPFLKKLRQVKYGFIYSKT